MQLRNLGIGIHARCARRVAHVLTQRLRSHLLLHRLHLFVVGTQGSDHGKIQLGRYGHEVVAEPELQVQVTGGCEVQLFAHLIVDGLHGGRESLNGLHPHTALGDLGILWIEDRHTEVLVKPLFLAFRIVAASGQCTGMTAGATDVLLPASGHTNHDGLVETKLALTNPVEGRLLVVSTGLHVKGHCFGARIVLRRVEKFGQGEVNVDVLARTHGRGNSKARGSQIFANGRGEVAAVTVDGHRTLA